jgi:hypothetical protein
MTAMTSTSAFLETKKATAETTVTAPVKGGVNLVSGFVFILGTVLAWAVVLIKLSSLADKLLGR